MISDPRAGALENAMFLKARSKSASDRHVAGPCEAVVAQQERVDVARVDSRLRHWTRLATHELRTVLDEDAVLEAAPPPIQPCGDGRHVSGVQATELRPDVSADETG